MPFWFPFYEHGNILTPTPTNTLTPSSPEKRNSSARMMSVSTSHAFLRGEFLSSLLAQHSPPLRQVDMHTHTDQPTILPVLVSRSPAQPSPAQPSPAQAQQSELNEMISISTIIWPEVTRITRLCCLDHQLGWRWGIQQPTRQGEHDLASPISISMLYPTGINNLNITSLYHFFSLKITLEIHLINRI